MMVIKKCRLLPLSTICTLFFLGGCSPLPNDHYPNRAYDVHHVYTESTYAENIAFYVFFAEDQTNIQPQYYAKLTTLAANLKKDFSLTATIIGYFDTSSSSIPYSQTLATRRASAIAKYLKMRGVPSTQIIVKIREKIPSAVPERPESVGIILSSS